MKKIFSSFFAILLLSSCFGSQDSDWLTDYSNSEFFSVRIPANWEILENTDSILPKPRSWNIELATRSTAEVNGFSNNLLILSEDLKTTLTNEEYITSANKVWASDYFENDKIEEKIITFSDWTTSKIFVFDARYNDSTPKLRFLQTAKICNENKAIFTTLALPTSTNDYSKYENIFVSLKCKN